jgi:hypothetical protein
VTGSAASLPLACGRAQKGGPLQLEPPKSFLPKDAHTHIRVGVERADELAVPLLRQRGKRERPPRSGLRTALARETGRRFIVWLILCVRLCGNVLRCGDGERCACCLDNAVI